MGIEGTYYREVDVLKGLAIFFVTLGHAIILFPVNLHQIPACALLFEFVSSLHMELFFLVSGFCFRYGASYGKFMRGKILRLALPYVVFNLLDMIPRQLMASLVNRPRPMGESLAAMALYGGELWFLYALFVIFLLFPLLHRFCGKYPWGDGVLLCLTFGLTCFWEKFPAIFVLNRVCQYLFYFTAGYALRRRGKWFRERFLSRFSAGWAAVFLALWCGLFALYLHWDPAPVRVAMALCGSVFLLWLARWDWVAALFAGPGKYSLQIYLFNGFLLVPCRWLACNALGLVEPWLIIGINMMGTFVCSYWFTKLVISRFRVTRLITGLKA